VRRIERVSAGDFDMVGTVHEPDEGRGNNDGGIGFLFLNAGHMPREGHAGMIAGAADDLCDSGFTVFRFDLPGLGDSPGSLPEQLESFFRLVHAGVHTEAALALARELLRRKGLSKLVMGGLCGGAATALFVADRAPEITAGLIALEAEFLLPGGEDPATLGRKVLSRASWLRLLTGHSRYRIGRILPRRTLLRLFGKGLLPPETNIELVRIWKELADSGTPILVMMAAGRIRESFYDQMNQVLFRGKPCKNVTDISITNTNHIFTSGNAPDRIKDEIRGWGLIQFGGSTTQ